MILSLILINIVVFFKEFSFIFAFLLYLIYHFKDTNNNLLNTNIIKIVSKNKCHMKIKNYSRIKISETFCSLRTTTFVFLLGVFLFTNATVNAQNNALHFDGVNDYVEIPASINSQILGNNVTVEGWFNIGSIGDQVELIGEWYDAGDSDIKFAIYYNQGDNSIYSIIGNGGIYQQVGAAMPALNTWVHIASTYDGANLRLYYNGLEVGVLPTSISLPTVNGLWVLGKRTDGAETFGGKMDEVRIWNTTRSAAEILANYKNQVPDNSTGLIAYYKMNQGVAEANNTSITSLTDSSVSNLNGTFQGSFALTGSTSNFVTGMPTVWDTNWSFGTPDSTTEAIIDGTYSTTTNGTISAKKLTVNSGKSLTVNTGTNITVQNEVINNGSLIVENDANLIQVNNVANTGNAVVKRNSNSLYRLDYTMWSSPVASQNLLAFSPATTTTRFYNYNSSTNLYNAVADPSTTNFTKGLGVLIRMPNTDPTSNYDAGTATLAYPGVFTGVLNNGDINLTGLTPGQYVAVGNPYPSNIRAIDFINANLDALDGGTLYLWRKKNGEAIVTSAYATMNKTGVTVGVTTGDGGIFPNGYISVGQGFITTVPPSGTIAFNNGMRTANTATFLRTKAAAQPDRVWINLTNTDGAFSQMLVGYMDGATTGFDAGFDGKYINDAATALTSDIAGEEYVIQGRPTFSDTDVVNLNFKASAAGTYTIAKDHVDGLFATGQDIYLVDKTTGVETNLQKEAYTFTAAAGVNNTRFQLTYKTSASLKVNDLAFDENSISVYKQNGVLNINAGNTTMKSVKVFDVTGRLVLEQKSVNATTTALKNLAAGKQALLIQITSDDNRVVTKKAIN